MPRRELLSPGRLYALLNQEFKAQRDPACPGCTLPAVEPQEASTPGGPNWGVGKSMALCTLCEAALERAIARLGDAYELHDLGASLPGTPDAPLRLAGYDVDAQVSFMAPGQYFVKARALSLAGTEVFAVSSETVTREEALQEKDRLIRHLSDVLVLSRSPARKRRDL